MDKSNSNKSRTDMLAAGRKKLQQYRKKKDGKGSKKAGKSEQEAKTDAAATAVNLADAKPPGSEGEVSGSVNLSDAKPQVSGDKGSGSDYAREPVNPPSLHSTENVAADIGQSSSGSLPVPILSETGEVKASLPEVVELQPDVAEAEEVGQSLNVCNEKGGDSSVQNKAGNRSDIDKDTANKSSLEILEMVGSEKKPHHVSVSTPVDSFAPSDLVDNGGKGDDAIEVKPTHGVDQEKGLWLAEVFNVVYKGHTELKPENQIGTIKVNDGVNDHYLYKVNRIDKRKPSIQHLDELVLTGPRSASISAKGSFTIDVDLFCGAYKDSLYFFDCPDDDDLEICCPLENGISLRDGFGEIYVQYAIFDNATEAHLEFKFLPDDNFTKVYGVVAASTSKIEALGYSSMLFVKKPSDKIKVVRGKLFPLSRSIVAVPLDSKLFVDIHLKTGDEHELVKGTVKFLPERSGTSKKLVQCKKCKILVKVTWKCS